MAMLLAAVAATLGQDGLKDYEPPSERLAGSLAELVLADPEEARKLRRSQALLAGGDVIVR